ncbi:hypothetical protein BHE74_00022282 [Ensete ventricosum]|nr:hypothetical protein BHE74_00022282 [Ensete ventricosum]
MVRICGSEGLGDEDSIIVVLSCTAHNFYGGPARADMVVSLCGPVFIETMGSLGSVLSLTRVCEQPPRGFITLSLAGRGLTRAPRPRLPSSRLLLSFSCSLHLLDQVGCPPRVRLGSWSFLPPVRREHGRKVPRLVSRGPRLRGFPPRSTLSCRGTLKSCHDVVSIIGEEALGPIRDAMDLNALRRKPRMPSMKNTAVAGAESSPSEVEEIRVEATTKRPIETSEFGWGVLHPTLAKDLYTLPSEILMAQATKQIALGHHYQMALLDRVHDAGRLVTLMGNRASHHEAEVAKLKLEGDPEQLATARQQVDELQADNAKLKSGLDELARQSEQAKKELNELREGLAESQR